MSATPISRTHTVALLGALNPAVFTPDWVQSVGLFNDGESVTMRVTSSGRGQEVRLSSGHRTIVVTSGRFQVTIDDENEFDEAIRVASDTFALLRHTPLVAASCSVESLFDSTLYRADILDEALERSAAWIRSEPGERRVAIDVADIVDPTTSTSLTCSADAEGQTVRMFVHLTGQLEGTHTGAGDAIVLLGQLLPRLHETAAAASATLIYSR